MRLVVGLGNPEERYKSTRHNVGFYVADRFVNTYNDSFWKEERKFKSLIYKGNDLVCAKPTTYMNSSGIAVSSISIFYKIDPSDIFIIHDDLDIKLEEYKIHRGKGPRIHKGILSIEKHLDTSDFWRVRVGVDNRDENNRTLGEEYVLQNFAQDEIETIRIVVDNIIKDLKDRLVR